MHLQREIKRGYLQDRDTSCVCTSTNQTRSSFSNTTYIFLFPKIRLVPCLNLDHKLFHPGILWMWEGNIVTEVRVYIAVRIVIEINMILDNYIVYTYLKNKNTYWKNWMRRKWKWQCQGKRSNPKKEDKTSDQTIEHTVPVQYKHYLCILSNWLVSP